MFSISLFTLRSCLSSLDSTWYEFVDCSKFFSQMFSKFDLIQILKQGHVYCRLMYIVLQIFSNRFVCLWLDNLNLAYFVTCNLFCHTPSIQFHVNSWKSGQTFCMVFFFVFHYFHLESYQELIQNWTYARSVCYTSMWCGPSCPVFYPLKHPSNCFTYSSYLIT